MDTFVIVSGLSGAGKSTAVRVLEDMGYFCVDNLPPELLPKFAELCLQSKVTKVALGIDIRGGGFFEHVLEQLSGLDKMGLKYSIVFLEASEQTLIRRYKETRRRHPLAGEGRIADGIEAERSRMQQLRNLALYKVDTSHMTPAQLKEEISMLFSDTTERRQLLTILVSFGFKRGLPLDADMILDVRFLANPYYVEELRNLTGKDKAVREYVLELPEAKEYLSKAEEMLEFLLPEFIKEGKTTLVIGIGCTGGCHRSVAIAEKLGGMLAANGQRVFIQHRDVEKEWPYDQRC